MIEQHPVRRWFDLVLSCLDSDAQNTLICVKLDEEEEEKRNFIRD